MRWMNRRVGSKDIDHFSRAHDAPSLITELEAAGISHAVVVARSTPTLRISNDSLSALAAQSDRRLIGVGSVDPLDLGRDGAVAAGGGRYVDAARGFLARQLLFGTSYPFRPLAQTVLDFLALDLPPDTHKLAMWDTPNRLLGLGSEDIVP